MASVIDTEHFRGRAATSQGTSGDGGGTVDQILKRLGIVEAALTEIGGDVREMKGTLPHLATKAEITELRADMQEIRGALPHLAPRSDVQEIKSILPHLALRSDVQEIKSALPHFATRAELRGVETRIIKWFIGTAITLTALVFSIARFVV